MNKKMCILLPGTDGTGELFKPFVSALPDDIVPIVIRYPNNCEMSYPELADYVLSQIPNNEEYCIIAESFAGPIAMIIANKKPSGLKGLVLVATFAKSPFSSIISKIISMAMPLILRVPLSKRMINFFLLGNESQALAEHTISIIRSIPRPIILHRIILALSCDVQQELTNIDVPILAIKATKDLVLTSQPLKTMKANKHTIEIMEVDSPHFVLQIRAKNAVQIITPFVERIFI